MVLFTGDVSHRPRRSNKKTSPDIPSAHCAKVLGQHYAPVAQCKLLNIGKSVLIGYNPFLYKPEI